jgi:hypothetical protein
MTIFLEDSYIPRWLVKLDGDPFDLEEYPVCFPKGEVQAVTIGLKPS